jgi:hypothetical protein
MSTIRIRQITLVTIIAVMALLGFFRVAHAQIQWQPVNGPSGGWVKWYAFDRDTVYAVVGARLYKLNDDRQGWVDTHADTTAFPVVVARDGSFISYTKCWHLEFLFTSRFLQTI